LKLGKSVTINEHNLRVFETNLMRKMFQSKREEVAGEGGWRRLHNEELHNLIVSLTGDMRNAYTILVGKPEGKRNLGRPRHRWEDINWTGL
jgi:hypothetical protein